MDYWAYSNNYNRIHPLEKTILSIITMLIVLLWENQFLSIIVFIGLVMATIVGAGIPYKVYLKYISIPLTFVVIAIASVAIEIHSSPNVFIYKIMIGHIYVGITQLSLSLSFGLLMRSMAALACLYFLALTTPIQEIIYLLEKIHCPKIVTELMVLIYRFIFIFMSTARTIYHAQSSRLGYSGFKKSIKSLSVLCSVLFVKAYLHSKVLYQATLSRGYQGTFYGLDNSRQINVKRIVSISILEIVLFILGGISR